MSRQSLATTYRITYACTELEKSTQLFGILADPNGSNNAIAQVLYGLALR